MAHFLCRLSGPRPSFPMDMTPHEAELMGAHAAYWSGKAEEGVAVVFGPVMDPAGVWGLGITETPDAAATQRLLDADPVILAGAGFSWSVAPMPQVGLRRAQARDLVS